MTELSTLLNRHRSIRSYKADPIPAGFVEQVLGDAVAGSSSSGKFYTSEAKYDPVEFRRDSEELRRLLEEKHFLP
jgi:nitroreductase